MPREDAVRQLQQEHGPNLALFLNHPGGKDSTRMLGFVRRRFPDSLTYAVMADTGFEHQKPISAVEFARQRCAEFGLQLTGCATRGAPIPKWMTSVGCSVRAIPAMHLRSEARTDREIRSQPASSSHCELHWHPC